MKAKDFLIPEEMPLRSKLVSDIIGFLIIGVVGTGIIIAMEHGLLVPVADSYTPAQRMDKLCSDNGGMKIDEIFRIKDKEFSVNMCVWGVNEQSDSTGEGTSQSVRPSDSDDAAPPPGGLPETPEVDSRKRIPGVQTRGAEVGHRTDI